MPLVLLALAYAGDGIPPRGSGADYPASQSVGDFAIGAACVSASTARQIFNENLDRAGYVVFELGLFPLNGAQADVATADFRLRQGSSPSIVRAVTPHTIAATIYPEKASSTPPSIPSNVQVHTSETIGYQTGPAGHGVYTATGAGVAVGHDPNAPPPPPPNPAPTNLEDRLEQQSLPEGLTSHPVAGYVFFPKPSKDKHGVYELMYLGKAGQASLKLPPPAR